MCVCMGWILLILGCMGCHVFLFVCLFFFCFFVVVFFHFNCTLFILSIWIDRPEQTMQAQL